MCACPVLRPRRDRVHQAIAAPRRGLRSVNNDGSRDYSLSRLNSTAFALAVYASQAGCPGTTQDSLPAAGQALPGGVRYPQGSNERFPRYNLFLLSQDRSYAVAWQGVQRSGEVAAHGLADDRALASYQLTPVV